MADTTSDGTRLTPRPDAYRRVGLTKPEAVRLVRTHDLRENTRSPWEASPIGVVFWLIWKAMFKGFQGLWLVASLALAVWFAAQIIMQSGGLRTLTADEPTLNARLERAVVVALSDVEDPRGWWERQLRTSLAGDARRRADIEAFRSWLSLGPLVIGDERLALEYLDDGRGIAAIDAELRAGPAWQREAVLASAREARAREARQSGLEPTELLLVPEAIRTRYQRALFTWSIADTSATAFFRGERIGQFELTSLPGVVAPGQGRVRLHGGVRQFVIQLCAHARQAGCAVEGCSSAVVPRDAPDALVFTLAALEAGVIRLDIAESIMRDGAATLSTAYLAGRLDPALVEALDPQIRAFVTPDLLLDAGAQLGMRPDLAFSSPRRAEREWRHRIDRRGQPQTSDLTALIEASARLRRATRPSVAIRLLQDVDSLNRAEQLAGLSGVFGNRILALQSLLGDALYELTEDLPEPPRPDPRLYHGLYAALLSALMVLLLTVLRLSRGQLVRQASRLSALDAKLCHLFLGRKD